MTCPRCQHENPAGSKFCLECGAKFALKCTSCGVELPPGAKFCRVHHLATAATMFRDMAMRSWLEKAKAEMDEGAR